MTPRRQRPSKNGNHPDGQIRVCAHCDHLYRSHARGNIFQICPRCKKPLYVDELLRETTKLLKAACVRITAAKWMATSVNEFEEFILCNDRDDLNSKPIDHDASLAVMSLLKEDIERVITRMDMVTDLFTDDEVDLEYLEEKLKSNLEKAREAREARINDESNK